MFIFGAFSHHLKFFTNSLNVFPFVLTKIKYLKNRKLLVSIAKLKVKVRWRNYGSVSMQGEANASIVNTPITQAGQLNMQVLY